MREADVPSHLSNAPCPEFDSTPWVDGPPAEERRVALISTAGLMQRGDTPFSFGAVDYRIIDLESDADLLMTHISVNFDRSGFTDDYNVVLPLERLKELAGAGTIGAAARYHYSFMGATEPEKMEPAARLLAQTMQKEEVDLAILVPV